MKKTTLLMMLASATLLIAEPAIVPAAAPQGTNMGQGKGMGQGMGQGKGANKQGKGMRGHKKHKKNSPFLIRRGLPHMTKLVMKNMDDASFALTAEQKEKLAKVRTATMASIKEITPQVVTLREEIIKASTSGTPAADLKEKVEKLASLEVSATMTHLKCIEETKAILTKDQLLFLLANKRHGRQTR